MALYDFRIAAGHDVALITLSNIESITPSGDRAFRAPESSYGTYNPGIAKFVGAGTISFSGFPYCLWTFHDLTRKQYQYLQDTYCGGSQSGPVTIYCPTDNPGSAERYNAIMILPPIPETENLRPYVGRVEVRMTRMIAL